MVAAAEIFLIMFVETPQNEQNVFVTGALPQTPKTSINALVQKLLQKPAGCNSCGQCPAYLFWKRESTCLG
jgi:Ni,Fe-hydrogenase III small subunit